ncbi:MAG: hypothetical protein K0S33_3884 [Bacteroidetes bacterium]|jgi:hypothetical protein|nr:hypothetical protein [Bacteroidota bacterium]
MREICTLLFFLVITLGSNAQSAVSSDSSARASSNSLQLNEKKLSKRDQTILTAAEQAIITDYINTLDPRVMSYQFINGELFVSLERGFRIFDLMEGFKERGVSLMYIEGKNMHFVNDDLKIETWSIK